MSLHFSAEEEDKIQSEISFVNCLVLYYNDDIVLLLLSWLGWFLCGLFGRYFIRVYTAQSTRQAASIETTKKGEQINEGGLWEE